MCTQPPRESVGLHSTHTLSQAHTHAGTPATAAVTATAGAGKRAADEFQAAHGRCSAKALLHERYIRECEEQSGSDWTPARYGSTGDDGTLEEHTRPTHSLMITTRIRSALCVTRRGLREGEDVWSSTSPTASTFRTFFF